MDLSTAELQRCQEAIEQAREHNYEFEIVLDNKIANQTSIHASHFQKILTFLCKHPDYELMSEESDRETLDIRAKNNSQRRLTIIGKANVLRYCQQNRVSSNMDNSMLIKKVNVNRVRIEEYPFRANVNQETNIHKEDRLALYHKELKNAEKSFRYKKRYSFLNTKKTHRVDMSIVKESKRDVYTKTFYESNTLENNESFEVEVEYLNTSTANTEHVLNDMLQVTHDMLTRTMDTMVFTSQNVLKKSTIYQHLFEYAKLVDPTMTMDTLQAKPGFIHVLRYQPITLIRQNMQPVAVDVVSILENYSVTDKADGERLLLYIDSQKRVFFINSRLQLFPTDMTSKTMSQCILDGEYVKTSKTNTQLNAFLCFDVYFMNRKDVRSEPLVKRIEFMHEVVDDLKSDDNMISFSVKTFEYMKASEDGVFHEKVANVLRNSKKYAYETDGLIFTPLDVQPGGLYPKYTRGIPPFGGAWMKAFKWKPPEQNSVDVYITFGIKTIKNNQTYVIANMCVMNTEIIDKSLNLLKLYKDYHKKGPMDFKKTKGLVHVDTTYLLVDPSKNEPLTTETKEPISDGSIVEMVFSNETNVDKWLPLRLRKDKVKPNAYPTYMNVLKSIQEPIHATMLTSSWADNEEVVNIKEEEKYYARENQIEREQQLMYPMQKFHGMLKRRFQFDLFQNQPIRLLELGSGKGGDHLKWSENKFKLVVGVDNNKDNLMNPESGAFKRMFFSGTKPISKSITPVMYLLLDLGEEWTPDYIDATEDPQLKQLANIAFGIGNTEPFLRADNGLKPFDKVMTANAFNLVSCQFAIHYLFKSMDSLDIFCKTLNTYLAPGGYFIGTCLDGKWVDDAFKKSNGGSLAGKVKEHGDATLWQITKQYDMFNPNDPDQNIGKQIDVFIESINQVLPEYLVDFDLLQSKLKAYGIVLLDVNAEAKEHPAFNALPNGQASGSFEDIWNVVEKQKATQMSDTLKEYSFLNRWFIFKKDT